MPFAFRLSALLVALAAALVAVGCASKPAPTIDGPAVRLAVLNGVILYEVPSTGEVVEKGWAFTDRQSYRSNNVGIQLAGALAKEFDKLPGVEVWSREDFAVYMSQKERILRRDYPDLTPQQRKALLDRQDPLDYGRSLAVDYVLRPEVNYASTVANRWFGWWYSTMDVKLALYDVEKGEAVWTMAWKDTDSFDSQLALMEECARESARAAGKAGVFKRLPPPAP